ISRHVRYLLAEGNLAHSESISIVAIDREGNFGTAKPRTVTKRDPKIIFTWRKRKLRVVAIFNYWDLRFAPITIPFALRYALHISEITDRKSTRLNSSR